MKKTLLILLIVITANAAFAQQASVKQLNIYQDSLKKLGLKMINEPIELERKNANYAFIKTLVSALKINNSFLFKFDSLKTISILNSPDNKFRIFSWYVMHDDGSYRFYGSIQMNTGGPLVLHGLEDYSPLQTNPEDSVVNNRKWFGAQYYKIIPVYAQKPYYVLLGWKGNTVESTKKVIEVLSFVDNKPQFGLPVFDGNSKTRRRVVFEYTRTVSMLLRYVPEQNLIVFDHLVPPDKKMKDRPQTFGPDLSYDGYKLQNGHWQFVSNLDMKNIPDGKETQFNDPKKSKELDKQALPPEKIQQ
ncbi:hypothetical protein HQ865_07590 [Mucilaginibacter mali]|uniref:Uncharacterized protein n=1 Tax=Mucilaginibacter mali TaxID=2740462 RepID=A0A7D4UCQ8_9SPHI|nr:hypothetical protein [Mucilaginibacter mali]QKJ29619.1 hypothetical protein HQ865_07590 [Mucilaginibacter mali]